MLDFVGLVVLICRLRLTSVAGPTAVIVAEVNDFL